MTAAVIVVAVLTYRRPEDLAALLPLLDEQVHGVTGARVLVVDNDPDAGGLTVVRRHAGQAPLSPVSAVHEPTPGISAARNRALAEAADADILVFIDDDERPAPGWLSALLETHRQTGAAAVAGPVRSEFAVPPDPWVVAGGFFDRRRPTTGAPIAVAATNNLLLHLPTVRAAGLSFDPAFAVSGGEDTLFTRQLGATGAALVWCAEAVVVDVVPAARVTRGWVLRRAYSSGNSATRVQRALARGRAERARALARGVGLGAVRLVGGGLRAALGTLTGSSRHQARGLRTAARGLGMLAGVAGRTYAEYAPSA